MPRYPFAGNQIRSFPEPSKLLSNIPDKYLDLLLAIQPVSIEDAAEYQRINQWIEAIEKLKSYATPDQVQTVKLLLVLIENYEDRCIRQKWTSPEIVLKGLMEERKLKQKDIVHIFGGHKSNVSSVLSGKRGISIEQSKELAALFKVPFSVFL